MLSKGCLLCVDDSLLVCVYTDSRSYISYKARQNFFSRACLGVWRLRYFTANMQFVLSSMRLLCAVEYDFFLPARLATCANWYVSGISLLVSTTFLLSKSAELSIMLPGKYMFQIR